MSSFFSAFTLCFALGVSAALADNKFKRLSAAEIGSQIIGKVVTDDAHWSEPVHRDGTLESINLGERTAGSWDVDNNEPCLTRYEDKGPRRNCYEVWRLNDQIEYRSGGITMTQGFLRAR